MESGALGFLIVFFILITSTTISISRNWRLIVSVLGLQYLLAFLLISSSWPIELAAVKLVTGWIAGAILGLTRLSLTTEESEFAPRFPTSRAFRVLAAGLVILVVMGAAPRLVDWAAVVAITQAWGGLLLIGMGLLQIGLSNSHLRTILGILTLFSGFEVIYAAVEASTLLAGLLAVVNLGIALVGSYLLLAPGLEARR